MTMVNTYVDMMKKGLLLQICDLYWCSETYHDHDNTYEFDNHESRWTCKGIDDALWSWIDTMIDTDEESDGAIWGDAIRFINETVLNKD